MPRNCSRTTEFHRLRSTVDLDDGFRPVTKQIATLPFAGDIATSCGLESDGKDRLTPVLGGTVLGAAFMGGVPMLRHQANHGFTPIIGPSQSLLPPHPGRDAGVRVKVDDDLADQAGFGALEPGLQRQRLNTVAAGMAHKNPGHR